jgi:hypothetical protein
MDLRYKPVNSTSIVCAFSLPTTFPSLGSGYSQRRWAHILSPLDVSKPPNLILFLSFLSKMVAVAKKIFEVSQQNFRPIACLLLIRLEWERLALQKGADRNALSCYDDWIVKVKSRLYQGFGLSLDDIEWLEEMVLSDEIALEALQSRMEPLLGIAQAERWMAVQELLVTLIFMLLSGFQKGAILYDSRLRSLFKSLAQSLMISAQKSKKSSAFIVSLVEAEVLSRLAREVQSVTDIDQSGSLDNEDSKVKKYATLGGVAVLGGLVVGLTGGLAVPLIAGGLSALGVAGSGLVAFGSVASSALVGTLFGMTGAGLAGFKINRHFQDLDEFFFSPVSDVSAGLSYVVTISGWIKDLDEAPSQWAHLTEVNPLLEVSCLQYDRKTLIDLTTAGENFIKSNIAYYGIYGVAVAATGSLAVAASLPITALQGIAMLDNPWNLALSKAEQAGLILARNILISFVGGRRPVTLVGHGMGARVIVYCLLELCKLRETVDIYSLIDSVFLLGASVSLSQAEWQMVSQIPSWRFVNCFSDNDWLLKTLFRLQLNPAAGTAPIKTFPIEDIDVSSLISSHGDYCDKIHELMVAIGFEQSIIY